MLHASKKCCNTSSSSNHFINFFIHSCLESEGASGISLGNGKLWSASRVYFVYRLMWSIDPVSVRLLEFHQSHVHHDPTSSHKHPVPCHQKVPKSLPSTPNGHFLISFNFCHPSMPKKLTSSWKHLRCKTCSQGNCTQGTASLASDLSRQMAHDEPSWQNGADGSDGKDKNVARLVIFKKNWWM